MKKNFSLRLKPSEAADHDFITRIIEVESGNIENTVAGFNILKKSIDARSRNPLINLLVEAFINEPYVHRQFNPVYFRDVFKAKDKVIIIGAGPAGLFAALRLIEKGIKPIIVERGKDVKARRRDLAVLNKEGIINPESNYCFGEGGAGTYSDGKLYTRSNKRGDVTRILNILVQFGADERILYEAHPHIGTNKLPQIITAIREKILEAGGEIHFETKVIDFELKDNRVSCIVTNSHKKIEGDAYIIATGHSARDIFNLLDAKKVRIERKPFALGVRVEHPQSLIDAVQYHCTIRDQFLPPSSYNLVQQVNGKGVFSFCMCPGGIIATASTNEEELVVNGWSPSKRNNPFANSGIVVSIDEIDLKKYNEHGPMAGVFFQQDVERKAYKAGGGKFVAPAQRMVDFCEDKQSNTLPDCSYLPGINTAMLKNVLPSFVFDSLKTAFKEFGKKMRGYYTNEAVIVATESRTSSPIRIPRKIDTLEHIEIDNLYPCGEGAGFAGGIVSAAMDGEKIASVIALKHDL